MLVRQAFAVLHILRLQYRRGLADDLLSQESVIRDAGSILRVFDSHCLPDDPVFPVLRITLNFRVPFPLHLFPVRNPAHIFTFTDQLFKALRKTPVILLRALRRTLQVMLPALSGFPGQVAFHQQAVDVVIRVPHAALVDCLRALSQRQGRDAVILGDHDIAPAAEVDQGQVHGVRPGPDGPDRAVIRRQQMIGVAQQCYRDAVLLRDALGNPRHRTGIRVNIDRHILLLWFFNGLRNGIIIPSHAIKRQQKKGYRGDGSCGIMRE